MCSAYLYRQHFSSFFVLFTSFQLFNYLLRSVIDVFRVGNTDPTPEVRLKASIFRQREHISFLEITITIVHESNDNTTTGFITDKAGLIMTAWNIKGMDLESVVPSDVMNQVVETNNASPDTANAGVNDRQQLGANDTLPKVIDIRQV